MKENCVVQNERGEGAQMRLGGGFSRHKNGGLAGKGLDVGGGQCGKGTGGSRQGQGSEQSSKGRCMALGGEVGQLGWTARYSWDLASVNPWD